MTGGEGLYSRNVANEKAPFGWHRPMSDLAIKVAPRPVGIEFSLSLPRPVLYYVLPVRYFID